MASSHVYCGMQTGSCTMLAMLTMLMVMHCKPVVEEGKLTSLMHFMEAIMGWLLLLTSEDMQCMQVV